MFDMHQGSATEKWANSVAEAEITPPRRLKIEFPLPPPKRHPASRARRIARMSGRYEVIEIEAMCLCRKNQVGVNTVTSNEDHDLSG